MKTLNHQLLIVAAFAVAMGILEAVVVVYLRALYFPDGFSFPLNSMEQRIYQIELARELTTMVMLVAVGLLAGNNRHSMFAWFLFTFGVWDLSYYAGLKLFLNWPASLLEWDILFLIPFAWTGPVLAPVISSFTMIGLSLLILFLGQKSIIIRFGKLTWASLVTGALLIFISFTEDFARLHYLNFQDGWGAFLKWNNLIQTTSTLVPEYFMWWLFLLGELLIIYAIYRVYHLNKP